MSRIRSIKPGFWKDEDIPNLSPWARLLFIGLWSLCDKEGRTEDRARRIKAEVFPHDSVNVEPLLQELEANKNIVRYTKNGESYIWVKGFTKHQLIQGSERTYESKIPPCDDELNLKGQSLDSPRTVSGHDLDMTRTDGKGKGKGEGKGKGNITPISPTEDSQPLTPEGTPSPKGKQTRMARPSLEDTTEFMSTVGGDANMAQDFQDYYESKGWKVGREPMKDWKAAARRWVRNNITRTVSNLRLQNFDPPSHALPVTRIIIDRQDKQEWMSGDKHWERILGHMEQVK